jgi:hypothetical protein
MIAITPARAGPIIVPMLPRIEFKAPRRHHFRRNRFLNKMTEGRASKPKGLPEQKKAANNTQMWVDQTVS